MTTIDSEEEGEAHLFACKCGGNATAVSCGAKGRSDRFQSCPNKTIKK